MSDQQAEQSSSLELSVLNWLDRRYRLGELINALFHVHIPRNAKTFYLGGITLFLFIVQGISGSLLALYYQPTPDSAYDSVLFIMNNVKFGWLIRSVHSWGANLMIVFCVLHLLRIFFQGAYKPPREMTWGIGVVLLVVTLGFGFTGYLLPWDQRAYWATTVGSESFGAAPLVGEFLLSFMRGGADVTGATLSRFFGVHVLLLPVSLVGFLTVHFVLLHQQGLADPQKPAKGKTRPMDTKEEGEVEKEKGVPFFPHYLLSETIAWYVIIGILIVLASEFPVGLEEKADPFQTPAHIKPEWYFLSLYQLLKKVPRIIGVLAPVAALSVLVFLPFIDRNPEVKPRKRWLAILIGLVVLIAIVGLTIWGWLS